jgi:hypothetical protein
MRASAIPGPFTIDLNLQRPAQERSHKHYKTKHANAGEGGVENKLTKYGHLTPFVVVNPHEIERVCPTD